MIRIAGSDSRCVIILQSFSRRSQSLITHGVPGLVADYGDRVDHFNNGLVDRNFILADESRYHANNSILEESVGDDIRVEKRGSAGYKVTYTIEVQTLNVRTNQTSGGKFDVELLVVETPTGLKITRQQTKKKP